MPIHFILYVHLYFYKLRAGGRTTATATSTGRLFDLCVAAITQTLGWCSNNKSSSGQGGGNSGSNSGGSSSSGSSSSSEDRAACAAATARVLAVLQQEGLVPLVLASLARHGQVLAPLYRACRHHNNSNSICNETPTSRTNSNKELNQKQPRQNNSNNDFH